ncbi:hypothetical protein [Vibrio profundi]|uniref:hypothetical protein n=1 Tax=Vibrio profundi TaxID=1774960 RepID=UPI0037369762
MRLSSLRIIWITCFSMFAMLSSNIASSEPLMMIKMMSDNHSMMSSMSCMSTVSSSREHAHSDDFSHDDMLQCQSEKQHNCCASLCLSPLAFLPIVNQPAPIKVQLALITFEKGIPAVERPQSLYRPPIA